LATRPGSKFAAGLSFATLKRALSAFAHSGPASAYVNWFGAGAAVLAY
jgi:hypothetical protein